MRVVRAEVEKLGEREYNIFFKLLDDENNWFSNMVSLLQTLIYVVSCVCKSLCVCVHAHMLSRVCVHLSRVCALMLNECMCTYNVSCVCALMLSCVCALMLSRVCVHL